MIEDSDIPCFYVTYAGNGMIGAVALQVQSACGFNPATATQVISRGLGHPVIITGWFSITEQAATEFNMFCAQLSQPYPEKVKKFNHLSVVGPGSGDAPNPAS